MHRLRDNAIANLLGRGWTSILSVLLIPVYVHFIGIESYGLIGWFAAIQSILAILDAGLAPMLNRELARLGILQGSAQEMSDLVRTLEVIYLAIAAMIGAGFVVLAPWSTYWLNPGALSNEVVQRAVLLMGLGAAVQWPTVLYSSGIAGLQRQVALNVANAVCLTLRHAGILVILWRVSATIEAFLIWQIATTGLHVLWLRVLLWRSLPPAETRPCLRLPLLRRNLAFAAGCGASGILQSVLYNLDKLVISRLLSLESFGYYAFASAAATSLTRGIQPLTTALFPRYVQMIAARDPGLGNLYLRSSQWIAALTVAPALLCVFFPMPLLYAWTAVSELSVQTAPLLPILAIGALACNFATNPVFLIIAEGRISAVVASMVAGVPCLVALLLWSVPRWGAPAAAACWTAWHVSTLVVYPLLLHRGTLGIRSIPWIRDAILIPTGAVTVVFVLLRWVFSGQAILSSRLYTLATLAGMTVLAYGACCLSLPACRHDLMGWFRWLSSPETRLHPRPTSR